MRKFIKKKLFYYVITAVTLLLIYNYSGLKTSNSNNQNNVAKNKLTGIEIEFIDVGQADSALITLENGTTFLIDGGDVVTQDELVRHLKDKNLEKIDYVIATHPHADHIGGLDNVLNEFEVGQIILPKIHESDIPTTIVYDNLLDAIDYNGCEVKRAMGGLTIYSDQDCTLKCLAPNQDNYASLNDYSAIIKVEYGEFEAIFMGDAEDDLEDELANLNVNLQADVLKVAHHGSATATSYNILNKVKPQYAIISVNEDNEYDHPHSDTLERLGESGAKVYRTDYCGNITITSDKKNINISTEKEEF